MANDRTLFARLATYKIFARRHAAICSRGRPGAGCGRSSGFVNAGSFRGGRAPLGRAAAYTIAALFPERVTAIVALALGYQPHGAFTIPDFQQSRRFWYQWFQCTDGGAEAVRRDPVGFARIQWDTWSPPGWFDDAEFIATADSFKDPDWAAITLNAYRTRWISGERVDQRYAALQRKLGETKYISTPTLMIQGAADTCDAPRESEGLDHFFARGYRRVLLAGVGHFPHREAPGEVAAEVNRLLLDYAKA